MSSTRRKSAMLGMPFGTACHRLRALEAGADACLSLPLHAGEMRARLRVAARLLSQQDALAGQQDSLAQQNDRLTETMGHMSAANRRFAELFDVICARVDITERDAMRRRLQAPGQALAHVNARLEEMVTLDGLTGLKNRCFLGEALEKAFSFATRYRLAPSVIMLDVDRFKSYNDTFGYPAGDDVLRVAGQTLRDSTRDHDICARYGGEEFAIVLPALRCAAGGARRQTPVPYPERQRGAATG